MGSSSHDLGAELECILSLLIVTLIALKNNHYYHYLFIFFCIMHSAFNLFVFPNLFFIFYNFILFIYITMHLHFDCQCLPTNSWTYFLDEAVIARALPRMMATEIC